MQQQLRARFGIQSAQNAQQLRDAVTFGVKLQGQLGVAQIGLAQRFAQGGQPVFIGFDGAGQRRGAVFGLNRQFQRGHSLLQLN